MTHPTHTAASSGVTSVVWWTELFAGVTTRCDVHGSVGSASTATWWDPAGMSPPTAHSTPRDVHGAGTHSPAASGRITASWRHSEGVVCNGDSIGSDGLQPKSDVAV
ncbi:unnamed protein product [Durusdinium trenchii]|uniref:Uncharacterized protein n=1 Tax=Durusdinium trenchii TaxID=1381693 RepID=A0ABP0HP70_9DINO